MIQIRNVPDDVHRRLKSRAALAGTSMSEWALQQLLRALERPSRDELIARVASRETVSLSQPAAETLREARDER